MTPEIAFLILQYGLKYGPDVAIAISQLFQKKDIKHDDIVAVFSNLKPYEAYGIPDNTQPKAS